MEAVVQDPDDGAGPVADGGVRAPSGGPGEAGADDATESLERPALTNPIKIRVAPYNYAAYVDEHPDENGVHHGHMKHSEEPVAVLWVNGLNKWIEVPHD